MKLPREDWNIKMGDRLIERNVFSISLIIFTLSSILFLSTNAQAGALIYCVTDGMGGGCSNPSAGTCTGGNACGAPCNTGPNANVCPSIADALACIAANMDAAAVVRVGTGTHTGPGTASSITNTAAAAQGIDILGGFASNCVTRTLNPTNTTVQAPMDDRVFLINNTTNFSLNVMVEGLTITGGDPNTSCAGGGNNGGGVCVATSAMDGDVMFTSDTNIYEDNTASFKGGGLAASAAAGGDIIFTSMNDTFTNNSAGSIGGAMYFSSSPGKTLDATIMGDTIGEALPCTSAGNEAPAGGGIQIEGLGGLLSVTSLGGNLISCNLATSMVSGAGGGGIGIINPGGMQPVTLSLEGDENNHDRILFNEAANDGGGILIRGVNNATVNVSISKAEIGNNEAGDIGGGIAVTGEGNVNLFPVVNNIIHNNIALGAGGGGVAAVLAGANADNAEFDIRFVNNTISDNQAPSMGAMGGGILADSSADTGAGVINWTLPNDIIFFNTAAGDGDQVALANTGDNATIAIRFSDIPQGVGNTDIAGVGSGVGFVNLIAPNISNDPLFVDRFNNDYHIQAVSPAANAGTKTAILTVAGVEADPPPDDFDGVPRDISMGAFEVAPSPTPTPTPTGSPTPTPTLTPPPTPTGSPTPPPTPPPPPNIVTFPNARNGKLVTIMSEENTVLSDTGPENRKLQGCPDGFNGQFLTFPVGSYQYVVNGLLPGAETTVIIELPPGTVVNSYFKFGSTPDNPQPHCYEFLFDGQTGAQISGTTVVVHHIDGARGDSDITPNGVIVEPGAPALLSDEPPGTGDGCSIGQTVSSQTALLNLLIPLLPAFAVGLRSLRRRKCRD